MVISILMFIFFKFFSFLFLGQIWSQNLKFFRLTEIWYRGRLQYTYFDFNVFLSKLLSFIFSLGKFGTTKSEVCEIKWNLVQGYIVYAYFDFNVYFFQISFHSYSYIPVIHILKFFKLTEIWYIGRLLYAYFDFIVYFFNFFVIHIRSGKFSLKTRSSSNWLKCRILMFIFSKF